MKAATKQWLLLASDDLDAVQQLLENEHLANIAAFHVQQCIEKVFKAVLEEKNGEVPKIYDLIVLYSKVQACIPLIVDADMLDVLNKLYIDARYPSSMGMLPEGKPQTKMIRNYWEQAKQILESVKREQKL